jgi:hypothetical protein
VTPAVYTFVARDHRLAHAGSGGHGAPSEEAPHAPIAPAAEIKAAAE